MIEAATESTSVLIAAACKIATAYVSNNHVAPADLPALVTRIHVLLIGWASQSTAQEDGPTPEQQPSASMIRASIKPEALISFIDGKPYKMLKRHLARHGFTPATYRQRYGLPSDYPVTAPSYSNRRSALAKEHRFGIVAGMSAKHRTK